MLLFVPVIAVYEAHARHCELRKQGLVQGFVLLLDEFRNLHTQVVKDLLRRHFFRPWRWRSHVYSLLQTSNSNLKEFIEIGAADT